MVWLFKMTRINYHSDSINPIPQELKTKNMVNLYNYLYDLQTKNRPHDFQKHSIYNKINLDRINRLGFSVIDSYTLKSLTEDEGSSTIFFSTDNNYNKICLKYGSNEETIDNPFKNEIKILFKYINRMNYKVLEFTKDANLNIFLNQNYHITPEMIELRNYLKKNNFEYMRACGTNNLYRELDVFDYGIFIDYQTKDNSCFNNNEINGRLYGYEIPEPLKSKLKVIPISILRSDILIIPDPEIPNVLDVFELDIPYELENNSYQKNTFYKIL